MYAQKLSREGVCGRLEPELESRIDELARYLEFPCKVVSIVRTRKERNLVCKSNPETFVDEGGGEFLRQRCRGGYR